MKWLTACLLVAFIVTSHAQETGAPDSASEEGGEVEGAGEEGSGKKEEQPGVLLKVPVTIKNGSSFERTLSAYDEVCKRYLFFSRRFQGWQSERVKVCTDIDGHADVTVLRSLGGRKRRFKEVELNDVLKF